MTILVAKREWPRGWEVGEAGRVDAWERGDLMRTAIFVIAGIQAALILAGLASVLFGDNDAAGRALGEAWMSLAAIAFSVVVAPALVLAWTNRLLPLALALALAGPVALAGLIIFAAT